MAKKVLSDSELVAIADKAAKNFSGQIDDLERAIGLLFVGRQYGWRILYLSHSKATINKYQGILKVTIRDVMPELGPLAKKSLAYASLEKITNFWKAVKGEVPGVKTGEIVRI